MTFSPFAVSVGHSDAADIAVDVLASGGNAVDAGVAASIALCVLHSEQVQLGGVAPMIIRMADTGLTFTVDGVGRWPATANRDLFNADYRGHIPTGILRTVVPGAPDAWISALSRFGTMGFAELAAPALKLAKSGFPAHADLVSATTAFEKHYRQNPENTRIWLPEGRLLSEGQTFVQADLASTLQRLIDADVRGAAGGGRIAGLTAVRDLFYKGDIAQEMARHVASFDGWLTLDDLAAHHCQIAKATAAPVYGGVLHTCGPWSQGPSLTQALMIYEQAAKLFPPGQDVASIHLIAEAINLALADREAFYGDPDFVSVPMDRLLSADYAAARASLIRAEQAFDGFPAAGGGVDMVEKRSETASGGLVASLDTSVAAIMDAKGNVFACTPSDSSADGPAVPGLGFVMSTRGSQSYTADGHPSALAPGKRPRTTACPLLFVAADGRIIAGGGPGADRQMQAMAQTLVYHLADHQSLAASVSAPRVFSYSAPSSGTPHLAFPGRLTAELGLSDTVLDGLTALGHKTAREKAADINRPSICLVAGKPGQDEYEAVGDPRRESGQRTGGTALQMDAT